MRPIASKLLVCAALAFALTGCLEETTAELPPPQEISRDAVGHYCGMIVVDHPGPKAQLFIAGLEHPVWFSSVRDAFAFMKLPGEAKNVRAIYVNDMGKATNWTAPEDGTWIDARKAYFVLGSDRRGGMGAKETVPFSNKETANAFIARHGGTIAAFSDIPVDYVLGDDEEPSPRGSHNGDRDDHGAKNQGSES